MMRAKLLVVTAVGLSAAACSYTSTTTQATAPYPAYRAGSEQACLDYGFLAGTDAYNRCVVRESEARARGRVPATYAVTNLTADAQAACYSYGLTAGTPAYDRCVGREIDARRYRDQAYVTPARLSGHVLYDASAGPGSLHHGDDLSGARADADLCRAPRRRRAFRPSATSTVSAMMARGTGSTPRATSSARSRPVPEQGARWLRDD